MHVLRVCHHFFSEKNMPSGLAPHFYYLSMALKKLGVKQTVICGKTDVKDGSFINGIQVFSFKSKSPFDILRSGDFVFKKIKELNEKGLEFDLIHYHNPSYFKLLDYKKELGIPIIQTVHGSLRNPQGIFFDSSINSIKQNFYFNFFLGNSLSRIDSSIIVSSEGKNNLIKFYGADQKKVFVIPTGVDSSLFVPNKSKKNIDLLYVGRFVRGKKITLLIDCFEKLLKEFSDLNMCLVGGSSSDDDFHNISEKIKKDHLKNIKIIESISQAKLIKYYQRAKVFVFPSTFEGLPKVLLEAMSCQLPAVAFAIGGNKDVIINGKNGFIVESGNTGAFCEKTKSLLSDFSLRKKIGVAARKSVELDFSWKSAAKKTLLIYKKLLKSR